MIFEEDLLRSPFSLRSWLRYISHKHDAGEEFLTFLFERAIKQLPGSYKLWKRYLDYRRSLVEKNRDLSSEDFRAVNICYERALCNLSRVCFHNWRNIYYFRCLEYGWTIVNF